MVIKPNSPEELEKLLQQASPDEKLAAAFSKRMWAVTGPVALLTSVAATVYKMAELELMNLTSVAGSDSHERQSTGLR